MSVHGLGEQHEEPGNEDPRIRSKCPSHRRGTEGAAEPLEPCMESDRKIPAWETQGTFDGGGVEKVHPRPPENSLSTVPKAGSVAVELTLRKW